MASDDEDSELQALRQAAKDRQRPGTDSGWSSLDALREKQRRAQAQAQQQASFFQGPRSATAEDGGAKSVEDEEEDNDEDDVGPVPDGVMVEDEAEVHEGLRAAFPTGFGRQEAKREALENVHSKTKRPGAGTAPKKGKIAFNIGGASVPKVAQYPSVSGGKEALARPVSARGEENGEVAAKRARVDGGLDAVRGPVEVGQSEFDRAGPSGNGATTGPLRADAQIEQGRAREDAEEEEDEGVAGPPPPRGGLNDDGGVAVEPPRPPQEELVGPPRPPGQQSEGVDRESDRSDVESADSDEDETDSDPYRIPLEHEIRLKGHTRVVSALAVDPTGSRVLTGGYDYVVKMFDFNGMDARLKSFRHLEPSEGHAVRALSWSPTADRFLVVTGSAQAKIYDRDGACQGEFVRGDMYIRDAKNTKGHITGCTYGEWHPAERQTALTSSEDGTVRIWDVTNFKQQKQVIKPKLARPGRISVTTCTWGPGGKTMAAGLADGSIQIWNVRGAWGSRPDLYVEKGHTNGEEISGLCFAADGNMVLSRATDGTLKVWDARKFKAPVAVFGDLPNSYGHTNVAFSPDEQLIVTGTSYEKGEDAPGGQIVFFDRERLELVRKVGIAPTQSVVRVLWHPRLNQIFATVGDKKEGATHVLYDPALSERGALVCVPRAPRKKSVDDYLESKPLIHNPHALPLFREELSRKKTREKARKDPITSKRPDLPVSGPGMKGRIGQAPGSLLTQYLLKERGLMKDKAAEEDPREAILKHAEAAAAAPRFIAPAYASTQPQAVYYESEEEEKDE